MSGSAVPSVLQYAWQRRGRRSQAVLAQELEGSKETLARSSRSESGIVQGAVPGISDELLSAPRYPGFGHSKYLVELFITMSLEEFGRRVKLVGRPESDGQCDTLVSVFR